MQRHSRQYLEKTPRVMENYDCAVVLQRRDFDRYYIALLLDAVVVHHPALNLRPSRLRCLHLLNVITYLFI